MAGAPDEVVGSGDARVPNSSSVLTKLPDAQVFARDAEQYGAEEIADTVARLSKIVARLRKARQDDAEVKEAAAKLKKANAAAKKAKAKKAKSGASVPADPMEIVI